MGATVSAKNKKRELHLRTLSFRLKPLPPFQLSLTVWSLRRRPQNIVDRWDGQIYRRVLVLKGRPLEVAVTQTGSSKTPVLQIEVTGQRLPVNTQSVVKGTLERVLGLRTDLSKFYDLAARDRQLGPLVEKFRGLKPPRYPSLFECLVNAIACQQITLALGLTLLNRLVEAYGPSFQTKDGVFHAFPRPEDLADLKPETFRALGFSRQKASFILGLSSAIAEKHLDLERISTLGDEEVLERLQEIRGVGRWTAEYAMLRGLGRFHVFPGDDVGGQRNLRIWLGLKDPLNYDGVNRILSRWQPYAGLLYFHLLLDKISKIGHLS